MKALKMGIEVLKDIPDFESVFKNLKKAKEFMYNLHQYILKKELFTKKRIYKITLFERFSDILSNYILLLMQIKLLKNILFVFVPGNEKLIE